MTDIDYSDIKCDGYKYISEELMKKLLEKKK